jgi:hypothetical protein
MRDVRCHACPLVTACLLLVTLSMAQESSTTLTAFPSWRLFPRFHADALAHQLSLSRVTDTREWIGTVGTSLPIAQMATGGLTFQVGVGATVFSRLIKTPGHITVSTVDYKIDVPVDIDLNAVKLRVGYGHISSHYADDAIEQLGRRSISAVKDYVMIAAARTLAPVGGFVYGGVTYSYHNEPETDKHWQPQIGAEVGQVKLCDQVEAYAAVDLKFKQEVGWGTTQSYQVGLRVFSRPPYGLRICYTLRTGLEERGQLYNQRTTANLVSIVLDH